jgi:hypothetical protein
MTPCCAGCGMCCQNGVVVLVVKEHTFIVLGRVQVGRESTDGLLGASVVCWQAAGCTYGVHALGRRGFRGRAGDCAPGCLLLSPRHRPYWCMPDLRLVYGAGALFASHVCVWSSEDQQFKQAVLCCLHRVCYPRRVGVLSAQSVACCQASSPAALQDHFWLSKYHT